jgi:hypothetical protein
MHSEQPREPRELHIAAGAAKMGAKKKAQKLCKYYCRAVPLRRRAARL